MYCYGGSNIRPQPGFWRISNISDNFIAWLYSAACLGYVSPSNNNLGECFAGYQGILWADVKLGLVELEVIIEINVQIQFGVLLGWY